MRDPRPRVDLAGLDQADDPREIARQGIARAEQRPFRPVKRRVAKAHLFGRNPTNTSRPPGATSPNAADIDWLLPVASITTSGKWPPHRSRKLGFQLVRRLERVFDVHHAAAEVQPLLAHVEHDRLRAGQPHELERRQADRPRADDQADSSAVKPAAGDGVAADGQRFDQGQLLERERPRDMQLAGRQR